MDEATKKQLYLHVAGATVRHENPFEHLRPHRNETAVENSFLRKWVVPVYLKGLRTGEKELATYKALVPQLTNSILLKMLGEFNWRTRIAGAYYAAISRCVEVEDVIGTHLLKSEVCYAGGGYCKALAALETSSAQQYLRTYLDYYLQRTDLDFDQSCAIGALAYLDTILGSNNFSEMKAAYEMWQEQAPHRSNAETAISRFHVEMENLAIIREAITS